MRNKRTEGNIEANAQLVQNYIPEIVPFMLENNHNKNRERILPNKSKANTTFENRKVSENVGKYYYKLL